MAQLKNKIDLDLQHIQIKPFKTGVSREERRREVLSRTENEIEATVHRLELYIRLLKIERRLEEKKDDFLSQEAHDLIADELQQIIRKIREKTSLPE